MIARTTASRLEKELGFGEHMNAHGYLGFLQASMSSSASELEWLESQRREWFAIRSKQAGLEKPPEFVESVAGSAPGAFQTQFVRETLLPPLLSCLSVNERAKFGSIPVGVLPLRTVDACAAKAPNGEPLILLDSGLFSMMSFYHETKLNLLLLTESRGKEEAIKYHLSAYRFILSYYARSGEMSFPMPDSDIKIPLPSILSLLGSTMASECFVLAHEIGHVLAGHFDEESETIAGDVPENREPINFFKKSQEQELQADAIGFRLYQEACNSIKFVSDIPSPFREIMPIVSFELVGLVERNLKSSAEFSRHPPTRLRVAKLLEQFVMQGSGEDDILQAMFAAQRASNMPTISEEDII